MTFCFKAWLQVSIWLIVTKSSYIARKYLFEIYWDFMYALKMAETIANQQSFQQVDVPTFQ